MLIAPWGLNLDWQRLSYASLAVCGLWIFTAIKAKHGYINAFRQGLARGDVEPETVRLTTADASTIETLVAELADPDEARVRYAIDVLESLDKRNLITPLLLYHESPKVRARALTALSAAPREVAAKWRSGVQRMLGDESPEVRAAAVGALATLGGEAQTDLVRPYLDDANPRIAATAAAVLAGSSKDEDRELAERTLTRLSGATSDRSAARREVAIALRQIRDPRTSLLLVPLLNDANPVRRHRGDAHRARARPGRLPVRAGAGVAAAPSRPEGPGARRPRRLRRGSRAGAGALPPRSRGGHLGAAARAVDAVAHPLPGVDGRPDRGAGQREGRVPPLQVRGRDRSPARRAPGADLRSEPD